MFPVSLGAGPRLLLEGATAKQFTLEANERYDNGVVYLAYRPA